MFYCLLYKTGEFLVILLFRLYIYCTRVLCSGEVLGELLSVVTDPKGITQLINLPKGSAEMELMAILPVFYVYDYLEQTEQWNKLAGSVKKSDLKRKLYEGRIYFIRIFCVYNLDIGISGDIWWLENRTCDQEVASSIQRVERSRLKCH